MHPSTPTLSLEKSPLEWNNHAVLLLEMGHREEAKVLFQKALLTLRASLVVVREEDHNVSSANEESTLLSNDNNSSCDTIIAVAPKHAFAGWSSSLLMPTDSADAFVYSRALYIRPVFLDDLVDLYSAAILFNLGLVHHILALTGHDGKSVPSNSTIEHCIQSKLFYDYAMNSIAFLEQNNRNTKEQSILKALLLNNLGQIFYIDSLKSEAAFVCFTAATSLLITVNINIGHTTNGFSLDDMDVGRLLRNVLLFTPLADAAAASA